MNYKISSIYFYPVKSISFQNLKKCVIKKDIGILNDRIFAISRLVDADKATYIYVALSASTNLDIAKILSFKIPISFLMTHFFKF